MGVGWEGWGLGFDQLGLGLPGVHRACVCSRCVRAVGQARGWGCVLEL